MTGNSILDRQKQSPVAAPKSALSWTLRLEAAGSISAEALFAAAVFLLLAGLDEPQTVDRLGVVALMCIPELVLWLKRRGQL